MVTARRVPLRESLDLGEIGVPDHRRLELELMAVAGCLLEEVLLRAHRRLERHDELLADGIDRRVRDLREELLEVAEEELRLVGEHRERRVGAHRADGLLAVQGHGRHEDAEILDRVAERLLTGQQGVGVVGGHRGRGRSREAVEPHEMLVEPTLIRLAAGDRTPSAPRRRRCVPPPCRRGTCAPAAGGPWRGRSRGRCRARRPRMP